MTTASGAKPKTSKPKAPKLVRVKTLKPFMASVECDPSEAQFTRVCEVADDRGIMVRKQRYLKRIEGRVPYLRGAPSQTIEDGKNGLKQTFPDDAPEFINKDDPLIQPLEIPQDLADTLAGKGLVEIM